MSVQPIIAPSILAADFSRFGDEAQRAEVSGGDWLHCDVMDGHFVPNITFGPDVIKALRGATAVPLDVHLMIDRPDLYAERFIDAGADHVIVHLEAKHDVSQTLAYIRRRGKRAGLAINPETAAALALPFLDQIDELLVMTVKPGFGGQSFMLDMMPKVAAIRQAAPTLDIVVDGGIDAGNAARCLRAGANVLVAGTSLFRHKRLDMKQAIEELRTHATLAD